MRCDGQPPLVTRGLYEIGSVFLHAMEMIDSNISSEVTAGPRNATLAVGPVFVGFPVRMLPAIRTVILLLSIIQDIIQDIISTIELVGRLFPLGFLGLGCIGLGCTTLMVSIHFYCIFTCFSVDSFRRLKVLVVQNVLLSLGFTTYTFLQGFGTRESDKALRTQYKH